MKYKTFKDFLISKHADQYQGIDDDMPDAYIDWITELQVDDIIQYADEHTEILLSLQKQKIVEEIEKMKKKTIADDNTYPDARWQKENYGSKQYNQSILDVISKLENDV